MSLRLLPLLVVPLCGCVQFSARPLVPEWTATSQVHRQESDGLTIAAQALGKGIAETQFIGRPTRARGYFPVVLLFENEGDSAFVIRRHGVRLETNDRQVFHSASLYEVFEDLKYSKNSALWGLPLGILPALVFSERIDDQNQEFLEDLREKVFRDIRIWKNPRTYNAVVFFKMAPERANALDPTRVTVSIEVEREDGDGSTQLLQFRVVPKESLQ